MLTHNKTLDYVTSLSPVINGVFSTELNEQKRIKAEFLHHRPDGASLGDIVKLFEAKKLRLPEITTMPLAQAADAQRQSESGTTHGKLVLEIQAL